jgi:uncharacterized protein YciW
MKDIFDSVLLKAAGIDSSHPLAGVVSNRANLFELSENAHNAALAPEPPGGLSHVERAALACRMARLNHDEVLARHYSMLFEKLRASGDAAKIADPAFSGDGSPRMDAIIRHTDLVAVHPKDAAAEDIAALKAAGIAEGDIVRLSELVAFVSYQVRVVAGLRLMAGVV